MAKAAGCKRFVFDGDAATLLAVDSGLSTEGRGNLKSWGKWQMACQFRFKKKKKTFGFKLWRQGRDLRLGNEMGETRGREEKVGENYNGPTSNTWTSCARGGGEGFSKLVI